jgi:transcriptional regulator NrdR family protein
MTYVIKRGGNTQKFSPSKLKKAIAAAIREAKVPRSERTKLLREVANPVIKACKKKKTIKSVALGKLVVAKLRVKSKEAAAKWTKYEKRRHKKRTHAKRRTVKKRTAKRKPARKAVHKKKRRR